MQMQRPAVIAGILAVAILACSPMLPAHAQQPAAGQPPAPAAATVNGIHNVQVERIADGGWMVHIDYGYTGVPRAADLHIGQLVHDGIPGQALRPSGGWQHFPAKVGVHRSSTRLMPPSADQVSTGVVEVKLRADAHLLASRDLPVDMLWLDLKTREVDAALGTGNGAEAIVRRAVTMIDSGEDWHLKDARSLLEKLLERRPDTDSAYVELARVAMKTNWNADGLREAESLLGTALQIRPDSVNAKVLLGYVYAHQGRLPQSEAMFVDAARVPSPNLYLWMNWGELLEMQDRDEAAIAKYRQAIAAAPGPGTYDRARRQAFGRLFALLEERKEIDAMEALHKQRSADYTGAYCSGAHYALFLVQHRGNADAAIPMLRDTPASRCEAATVRWITGLAYYTGWAASKPPQSDQLLRQARLFLPPGAGTFYQMALADGTMPAARRLLDLGEKIDQQDSGQMNALAYALQRQKLDAAGRLLRLGAKTDATIGKEQMPVALLPVVLRDLEAIRLMRNSGVDYTKLRYQGSTALDHARSQGDKQLLEALDPRAAGL